MLLFGILPAFFLRNGIISSYENRAIKTRSADVRNQCNILANQSEMNPYLLNPSSEVINTQLIQLANIYTGRVIVIDSGMKIIKDTFDLDEGKYLVSSEALDCLKGEAEDNYNKAEGYIEVTVPIKAPDSGTITGALIVSVSTDTIEDGLDLLRGRANIILMLVIAVVIVLSVVVSDMVVRPIHRTRKEVDDFVRSYTDKIDETRVYTELRGVVSSFNEAFARMKALDESRQEFVSNVSHELKTPITSMKVLADSLLAQEDAPIEIYQEFMSDIANEIDRENRIINDLLALVRLDKKAAMNIQNVNINDLLERIMKRLRPIAETRNIELVLESFRPVNAEVDEMKLSLALSNLMENAIKYNKDGGWVHVSLNADHKYFYVKVSDSGIGIPEEDIGNIFERFYRVDKSHSTKISGTGLGLAIARNAVVIHRGAIKVYSKVGEGTTFTVRIPLTYVA